MKGSGAGLIADWYGLSIADFVGRILSSYVDRPVIDKTGLTGLFDVHLEFVRENAVSGPVRLNGVDSPGLPVSSAETGAPSIFTALQEQLGLKLSPDKGSVDVLVVDHVERPSEN